MTAPVDDTTAPPPAEPVLPARFSRSVKVIIALILVIAAVARFYSIADESYWIDELYTLETSAGNGLAHEHLPLGVWLDPPPASTADVDAGEGIGGIVRHAPQDTQAPLYFAVLNVWRRAFGSSELAVRSLSAVCSLAAVAALSALICALQLPRAALIAMSLAAISGTQIMFAQEARPYAMALLWLLLAAIALARIERRGFTLARGTGLGLALLALILTHYTGVAPAVALLIYSLIRLRASARMRTVAAFLLAGCVFAAIWGRTALAQRREAMDRLVFLRDNPEGHTLRTLDRAICQPLSMLIAAPNVSAQSDLWRWIARIIGIALIGTPAVLLMMRRQPAVLLPWLLLIFPIAQTTFADLFMTRAALELPRFSFLSSAGALATAAALLALIRPTGISRLASTFAVVFVAVTLVCPQTLGRPSAYDRHKPNFKKLARELARDVHPRDVLVVAVPPGEPWQAGTLLTGYTQYSGAWPGPIVLLMSPPDHSVATRLRNSGRIWILSPTPNLPNDQLLPGSLVVPGTLNSVRNIGTAARIDWPARELSP